MDSQASSARAAESAFPKAEYDARVARARSCCRRPAST